MQRVIHAAAEMPSHLPGCTSFADLAEKQQAVRRRGSNEWLNTGQEILMAGRRVTEGAIQHLELR
jgi:hypothetical protein